MMIPPTAAIIRDAIHGCLRIPRKFRGMPAWIPRDPVRDCKSGSLYELQIGIDRIPRDLSLLLTQYEKKSHFLARLLF